MAAPLRVLHITPHLGGGVGRALVSVAEGDRLYPGPRPIERQVLCLEPPEKSAAALTLEQLGVRVRVDSLPDELRLAAQQADVVQCEVWNHPRLFAAWDALRGLSLRMVHWCHVSGLGFPRLPEVLWHSGHQVALTAACSLSAMSPALNTARAEGRAHVISSAAGFERWCPPPGSPAEARPASTGGLRLGYVGSLNQAKMHPDYVAWCVDALQGRADWPAVSVLGDEVQPGALARQCIAAGRPGLVRARGHVADIAQAHAGWDAFLYLLNPSHYGTAEIALIEAMASGLVPVVLPNPCEAALVTHGVTGWHVTDPASLRSTLLRMLDSPAERVAMAAAASDAVRSHHTTQRLALGLQNLYERCMDQPVRPWDPRPWMGAAPWQWFLSTVADADTYVPGHAPRLPTGHARHAHLERTKGSVHHFARVFPGDAVLQAWSCGLLDAAQVGCPSASEREPASV